MLIQRKYYSQAWPTAKVYQDLGFGAKLNTTNDLNKINEKLKLLLLH